MAKKPFRGNYLTLENVRISYDTKTDTVHLTSKDKDIPKGKGFHLTLADGRDAEYTLRGMLENAGLIPEDQFKTMPTMLPLDESVKESVWDEFVLGVGARAKEIVWNPTQSPNILLTGATGGGKSVIQRNLIFHCIQHSDRWRFLGIDLKRVELSPYIKYDPAVMGIAKNLEDAVEIIRYVNEEMMSRYDQMENLGVNNFKDLPDMPYAIMVMIDESYMLLAPSDFQTDEAKAQDMLRKEARQRIADIVRLGRAAGIHLVLSTQRPDPSFLTPALRENFTTRIVAGRVSTEHSRAALENDNASRINSSIRGRSYIQEFGVGKEFQSYFAPQDWIDDKLA